MVMRFDDCGWSVQIIHVSETYRAISRTGSEDLRIWSEIQGVDCVAMPGKDMKTSSRYRIPDDQLIIVGSRRDIPAVWGERYALDLVLAVVTIHRLKMRARNDVPQHDRPIICGRNDTPSVRGEGYRIHPPLVSFHGGDASSPLLLETGEKPRNRRSLSRVVPPQFAGCGTEREESVIGLQTANAQSWERLLYGPLAVVQQFKNV